MSLFENEAYQWRETFFILFREPDQPTAADVEEALRAIDSRYVIRNIRADEASRFESLTLEAPDDYSAMDISLVKGDDVLEQTLELVKELLANTADPEERREIKQLEGYR